MREKNLISYDLFLTVPIAIIAYLRVLINAAYETKTPVWKMRGAPAVCWRGLTQWSVSGLPVYHEAVLLTFFCC